MNRVGFLILALAIGAVAAIAWGAYAVQAPPTAGRTGLPGLQRLGDGLA